MQEAVCPGSLDTPGHSGRVCGGFRGVRQGPARIWEGAIRGYVGRQGYLGYLEGNRGCRGGGSGDRGVGVLDEGFRGVYEEYMRRGNAIQNFTAGNSVISVGIHSADYPEQLERRLAEKSLLKGGDRDEQQ